MDINKYPLLQPITPDKAVKLALEEIERERKGEQYGLFCDFKDLNIAMGKYFRFNNVNLFAGLSGHGKSYLVNTLNKSFLNYKKGGINENINFVPIILQFCFEMSAYNEILRSVASDMGVSYGYLLSSKYNKDTQDYNVLSDFELIRVKKYLEYYKKQSILFFENSGNTKQIYNTVKHYVNYYSNLSKQNGIVYKFIINIDHTLLIDTMGNQAAIELMADVGKLAITLRKDFLAMVNLIGQLNNQIEDVRRIITPALHYPTKSDIYAQGQLYNACDSVFTIHQPQLLKILEYGRYKKPTKDLIHLLKLKSRHGDVGSIWLKNNLSNGKIQEYKEPKTEENENLEDYLELPEEK